MKANIARHFKIDFLAVEYLIMKSALREFAQNKRYDVKDRSIAIDMLDKLGVMEKEYNNLKLEVI